MDGSKAEEQVDVVVVGGGQGGLAASYHLSRHGIAHVVLDAGGRTGGGWRERWDSLRLFTPARHDGLPGLPFPAPPDSFPTRDEMAAYLESYVERFQLPVRHGVRVHRLARQGERYLVVSGDRNWEAAQVIVATGSFQTHRTPGFAAYLDPAITQLHAGGYRNPRQLQPGPTLVVGAGNSGVEIALDAARAGLPTLLAGRDTGQVPPAIYVLGGRPFWFVANRVLTVGTPVGRLARRRFLSAGGPLIRHSMRDVRAAGVERVARVAAAHEGLPVLEDGRALEVVNVVWCTGFGQDFSWIDLPVIGRDGLPEHDRGIVSSEPGLSFVGLPFQSKLASAFIGGMATDAARVVAHVAARLAAGPRSSRALAAQT